VRKNGGASWAGESRSGGIPILLSRAREKELLLSKYEGNGARLWNCQVLGGMWGGWTPWIPTQASTGQNMRSGLSLPRVLETPLQGIIAILVVLAAVVFAILLAHMPSWVVAVPGVLLVGAILWVFWLLNRVVRTDPTLLVKSPQERMFAEYMKFQRDAAMWGTESDPMRER
jgi:hypothetical protein